MRSFPRTARSRMAAASVAVVIALGTLSVPHAFADDLKHKQKQVEHQVARAHNDVEDSSAQLRAASARLEAARGQLSDARTALATARGRVSVAQERDAEAAAALQTAEATLAQAEADLETGTADLAVQRDKVGDTIKRLYSQGDPDLMAFASLLDAESAQDLSRRADANDAVVENQTQDYDRLQASEVLLQVRDDQVAAARDDVAVKRDAAAANLVETQQLEADAEAAKVSVTTLVGERAAAQSEAAKVRAHDIHKLKQAEAEKARIAERLRRIAARALARARAAAGAAVTNARPGATTGLLQMPVAGGVTSPFGWRIHPIYGYWGLHDGADFGAGCGQAIVAAEAGKVISSYWSDVYGNRLIIDHGLLAGAGIATIYNHASSYTVSPGTQVQRGEVIGYVGDTGWSTGCHLHFTVMSNGKAVDPANFF